MTFDPRTICNLMLDEAARYDRAVSNLALQKLLYFAHSIYLIENGRPLVSGYFEAWEHGPVHPVAYTAFKAAGACPVTFRAEKIDALTGRRSPLPNAVPGEVTKAISQIISRYGSMTAGRLVEISHARGAPWHYVVDRNGKTMALGLRISDAVIKERFKYHKVSVGFAPARGEPDEDAPFARN